MPRSLKDPIDKPVIPKSDDAESIAWLANWLNNRRQQLYNNYKDSNSSSKVVQYSKPDSRKIGDIRDDGFQTQYNDVGYNPLLWVKGLDSDRITTNKIFYNQINNSASAPQKVLEENKTSNDFETKGAYVKPNHFNNKGHYIVYAGTPDDDVKIHERTHALNADYQERTIANKKDKEKYNDKYLDDEKEIYSRLMEYRFKNNLNPNETVDSNYLNKHRQELKDKRLYRYDDDFLLFLFNQVAQNNSNNRHSLEDIYIS